MHKNVTSITKLFSLVLAGALAAGCEASKSETPTSPNVAGPIAGVGITAPALRSPINGAEVVNTDPLRLVFSNAVTNGVRPLYYHVEVAVDKEFNQRAYMNPKVLPFEGEQTSLVVETKLDPEKTYYWRVRADDGANSSEFSATAHFDVVMPVVIGTPEAVSPGGGGTITTRTPELRVNNGSVQGRAGEVRYHFFVATDQAFSGMVWSGSTPRSGGSSTAITTGELPANTVLYWRAYATNGVAGSNHTTVLSFRTPAAAAPPPGGGGGGGGGLPPAPGSGTRTPDPAPGQMLPIPGYAESVIMSVAQQYPGALRNSCQESGGTWEFMDRVVDALRQYDNRWGYNWKRAHVGDPSLDAINYHWGRGASEGSRDVYTFDVTIGHCGSNPGPAFINLTDPNGAGAMWTGRGRFTN
jgi:hypothetical protein